jgi:Protein of unknown function (DUF4232)
MRPARVITAVIFAAAIAITGCSAHATATHPSPAPQPQGTAPPLDPTPTTTPAAGPGPNLPPSTTSPSGQPETSRCAASALRGMVQGSDGAAGTIWTTIGLRNTSARTCTLKGIPEVRLLGVQDQPVTAPSTPLGPAGSPVVLRSGQEARFAFSRPNACDSVVAGSRLRVTLPQSRDSLTVALGGETRFGTCAGVGVQALQASTTPTTPRFDRISDPQVAADRLVAAWLGGDRAAADKLTISRSVTERLFSEPPPATQPAVLPCRLVDLGLYLCSYPLGQPNELNVWVKGGASVGYGVSAVEFVD